MNDSEQKRIFLAIVLSGLVLVGWQAFFAPKTPIENKKLVVQKNIKNVEETIEKSNSIQPKNTTENSMVKKESRSLQDFIVINGDNKIIINNNLSIIDSKSISSIFEFNDIFKAKNPHSFQIIDSSGTYITPFFVINQIDEKTIEGQDSVLGINFYASFTDEGKFNINFNSQNEYRFRFIFNSGKSEDSNLLKEYILKLAEVERFTVGDDQEVGDGKIKWFGLDYHYHIFNYVFDKKQSVKYRVDNEKFYVETINPANTHKGYYIFTKKNYDLLTGLGDNLHLSVDFGFFGILAEPILRALQYIYSYIPNYGWAIIILTLFVKLLTFPLQIKSFKSMKKMQKLQPELAKIKEKFKDDLPRQQKETMELFKKAGANPLGGCFPLLLQMPVFFALYRVLYNAVELVNAPFYFWITDLSSKDPYYVLPVLMGVSMLGQMKLNPSTSTDPTQQKVMLFMPLIMGFFMKDLPAGLNLYIFVSTLFGIIQQLAVYKFAKD